MRTVRWQLAVSEVEHVDSAALLLTLISWKNAEKTVQLSVFSTLSETETSSNPRWRTCINLSPVKYKNFFVIFVPKRPRHCLTPYLKFHLLAAIRWINYTPMSLFRMFTSLCLTFFLLWSDKPGRWTDVHKQWLKRRGLVQERVVSGSWRDLTNFVKGSEISQNPYFLTVSDHYLK